MTERITEHGDGVTIIERRSSGSGVLIAIVLLFAVAIGAFYLLTRDARDTRATDAVTGAAKSVSDSAERVGDAADRAADSAAGNN